MDIGYRGRRLEVPAGTPRMIRDLILQCMETDPVERPTMEEVAALLTVFEASDTVTQVDADGEGGGASGGAGSGADGTNGGDVAVSVGASVSGGVVTSASGVGAAAGAGAGAGAGAATEAAAGVHSDAVLTTRYRPNAPPVSSVLDLTTLPLE